MVISYRNKFIKVFLSSILLIALILIFVTSLYKYSSSNFAGSIPDYVIFIAKYILPPAIFVTYGLYTWSHYLLAKAKGYSGWLALLAMINTIGLATIFLLPDRKKTG